MPGKTQTPTPSRDDLTPAEWGMVATRILARAAQAPSGVRDLRGDCLLWQGGSKAREGYGLVSVTGRLMGAHRAIYQALVGDIGTDPDTGARLTIDHLCRNTGCVNVGHMEPVTRAENIKRAGEFRRRTCDYGHDLTTDGAVTLRHREGRTRASCVACSAHKAAMHAGTATHCLHDHELTDDNVMIVRGRRRCRECHLATLRAHNARRPDRDRGRKPSAAALALARRVGENAAATAA